MMARSITRSNQRPDTLMQDRICQVDETSCNARPDHTLGQSRRFDRLRPISALPLILLQKSKVASVRIYGEILKREAIDDSDNLNRVTEVAYEFSVRR
jgi:hypothetical protein